jgi:hypothetical protein
LSHAVNPPTTRKPASTGIISLLKNVIDTPPLNFLVRHKPPTYLRQVANTALHRSFCAMPAKTRVSVMKSG